MLVGGVDTGRLGDVGCSYRLKHYKGWHGKILLCVAFCKGKRCLNVGFAAWVDLNWFPVCTCPLKKIVPIGIHIGHVKNENLMIFFFSAKSIFAVGLCLIGKPCSVMSITSSLSALMQSSYVGSFAPAVFPFKK